MGEVAGYDEMSLDELNAAVKGYKRIHFPCFEIGYYAAQGHLRYRNPPYSGPKLFIMPDFYIGAHADLLKIPLVTCSGDDYKYFPDLDLITPSSN